jgi:hypothetical protein
VTRRRHIYWPLPVEVEAGPDGVPSAVESVAVDAVREEWLVEDRWWTPRPLRRRYFELVLADGRNVVVFCEPAQGAEGDRSSGQGARRATGHPSLLGCGRSRWFLQRA